MEPRFNLTKETTDPIEYLAERLAKRGLCAEYIAYDCAMVRKGNISDIGDHTANIIMSTGYLRLKRNRFNLSEG